MFFLLLKEFKYLYHHVKRWFVIVNLIALIQIALNLGLVYLLQNILNTLSEKDYKVVFYCMVYVAVFITKELCDWCEDYVMGHYQLELDYKVTSSIFNGLKNYSLEEFENDKNHNNIRRVGENTVASMSGSTLAILSIVSSVSQYIYGFLFITSWDFKIGIGICLLTVVQAINLYKNMRYQYHINLLQTSLKKQNWYFDFLVTQDDAFKENKIFKFDSYLLKKYWTNIQSFKKDYINLSKYRFGRVTSVEFVFIILFVTVVFKVVENIFYDQILLGTGIILIQYTNNMIQEGKQIFVSAVSLVQQKLYLYEFFNFINHKVQTKKYKNKINKIELQNVQFEKNGIMILKTVNISLEKGNRYFVLGKNGSGKSSLIKLIAGLYTPTAGGFYINNEQVENIDFTSSVSFQFQDFKNFELNFIENIVFADSFKECSRVIENYKKRLNLRLQESEYTSNLGTWFEDSKDLSGGEWQKVALLRALAKTNVDLMIFDEPDAMLDRQSAKSLYKILYEMKDKIICVVTHDMSFIRPEDKIIFVSEGKVAIYSNIEKFKEQNYDIYLTE